MLVRTKGIGKRSWWDVKIKSNLVSVVEGGKETKYTWLKQKRIAAVLLSWGRGPQLLLHSHANHKYRKQFLRILVLGSHE